MTTKAETPVKTPTAGENEGLNQDCDSEDIKVEIEIC